MTKFLHSKRDICFVYSKSLKFYGKFYVKTLANVCKRDVLKDFAKFIRAFYKIYVISAAIHPALMISLPFSDLSC